MMKTTIFFLTISVFLFVSACDSSSESVFERLPQDLVVSEKLSSSNNAFSFDFWKNVESTEKKENYFLSPLSLHIALGMLLNGADQNTKTEIQNTLKLQGLSMEEMNSYFNTVTKGVSLVDPKVTNTIANAVFQDKQFVVNPTFVNTIEQSFLAKFYQEDFKSTSTVDKINKWAADNTNQKIKKVLDKIDPEMVMFLMNALYFKGDWSKPFKTESTVSGDFNGVTKKSKVMFMNQTETFGYSDNTDHKIAQLPYGSDKYSMVLILPKKTMTNSINVLTSGGLTSTLTSLKPTKIVLKMPKFTLEYSSNLGNVLNTMGMKDAFKPGIANLSKIGNQKDLFVSMVKQDTYLAVDEKGTEAAAVTTIGVGATSVPVYPEMLLDKPFLLMIVEKSSNTIQFIGKISQL
ncbi:MAG: serpin family protein [Leadbetterella sp.]